MGFVREARSQPEVVDGLYKWNVECFDKAGNKAFNGTNYTISIDTAAPEAFSLVYPLNNTESINRSPVFGWQEGYDPHFENYTLFIDDNPDFSSLNFVYKLGGNSSNNSIDIPDMLEGNKEWTPEPRPAHGSAGDPTPRGPRPIGPGFGPRRCRHSLRVGRSARASSRLSAHPRQSHSIGIFFSA